MKYPALLYQKNNEKIFKTKYSRLPSAAVVIRALRVKPIHKADLSPNIFICVYLNLWKITDCKIRKLKYTAKFLYSYSIPGKEASYFVDVNMFVLHQNKSLLVFVNVFFTILCKIFIILHQR